MTRQALGILGLGVGGKGLAVAGGNGLLNNLIAYWPGDEASGNLIDAHTNGLDLTDVNTVTNNTGLVYATARQYADGAQERHERPGDDALLSTGDVDFTAAQWVYLTSKAVGDQFALSKWDADPNNEYAMRFVTASDRFQWLVSNDGTVAQVATANNLGSPALSTWYLVVAWHDAANNQIAIQVNDTITDVTAHSAGVYDSAAKFVIGGTQSGATAGWEGRIGPSMFWKSAAGGGGVLTTAQKTALYNAGAGLTYAQFT